MNRGFKSAAPSGLKSWFGAHAFRRFTHPARRASALPAWRTPNRYGVATDFAGSGDSRPISAPSVFHIRRNRLE